MKKPIPGIRVFGQRSIAPSFPISVEGSKKVEKCGSFSEFLDSKLNKSVLFKPKKIEEGSTPFTSLVSSKDVTNGYGMEKKAREEKKYSDGGLEKKILEQFKPKEKEISEETSRDIITEKAGFEALLDAEEMDHMISGSCEISENITVVKDDKISRKRKDPFEGMESMNRRGKAVIVIGDNSKVSTNPMQRKRESDKKQRPTYNHYGNGSGWWDSDMEGVDSEEVGHSHVWEGVGSTTFGDILDWH